MKRPTFGETDPWLPAGCLVFVIMVGVIVVAAWALLGVIGR